MRRLVVILLETDLAHIRARYGTGLFENQRAFDTTRGNLLARIEDPVSSTSPRGSASRVKHSSADPCHAVVVLI
jgi:hypothetical protein